VSIVVSDGVCRNLEHTRIQKVTSATVAMNIPKIQSAIPEQGHFLVILFSNGKRKRYDINRLTSREMFSPLKKPAFCKNVAVKLGGIDISEYELWRHDEEMP